MPCPYGGGIPAWAAVGRGMVSLTPPAPLSIAER